MGSLWKELASRWLGGGAMIPEMPSRMPAETQKHEIRGEMLRCGRSRTPAPSRVTNGLEDQPSEETLQPGAAVRYRC